jgi:hemophore
VGSVANSTGSYLDTHPETNQALTTISQQQAGPQSLGALKTYFDANPQAGKDLQALQQPLVNLSGRCKLPITIPQLLGLMQAAQQQGGGLPSTLPGMQQTAQTLGTPGAAVPAPSAPAASVSQGMGPLPGPAAVPAR